MVELQELTPASVVSNILSCVSHPTAALIQENLDEVESNWDFLVSMQMLEDQSVSYCVKYFVVCQCSEVIGAYLSGLDLAPEIVQLGGLDLAPQTAQLGA